MHCAHVCVFTINHNNITMIVRPIALSILFLLLTFTQHPAQHFDSFLCTAYQGSEIIVLLDSFADGNRLRAARPFIVCYVAAQAAGRERREGRAGPAIIIAFY